MRADMQIELNKRSSEPLYVQLYKALKKLIEEGKINGNEKLPPIRKLSERLGINNGTVVEAYRLLEGNGYAYSHTGNGTYVNGKKAGNFNKTSKLYVKEAVLSAGLTSPGDNCIDFASSAPDPSLFPVDGFKKLIDEVIDRDGGNAFSYTELKGYLPLRKSIAGYMGENGVEANPDDIYIVSGAQQGIDIISKVLIDYGDIIFTEKPTYTGALAVFKSRGARIVEVSIKENGIDTEELEEKLKEVRPKFIYIMANFQNPTGYSYSDETKERILGLAEKYDVYIIEDDYLSELYYSSRKPSTLKSMDKHGRVIFIKSFSKILMPGARLGFLIVPPKMQSRVLAAKHFSDISSSGFMQRVFHLFLEDKILDSYVGRIRNEYSKRYKALTGYIDSYMKEIDYFKPDGGIHLWLRLPDNLSSNMVYSECLANKVIISPGSIFYSDSTDSQFFRLSYASYDVETILRGAGLVESIIQEMTAQTVL